MKTERINRKYNINDAEFLALMSNIIRELRKDIDVLKNYGIDEEKINYVDELCNKLYETMPDEVQLCDVGSRTQEMLDVYAALIEKIRMIVMQAKACFGAKSPFVKSLGMSEMTRFNYDTLIQASKTMIPTLTEALPQLAEYGFTMDSIAELSAKIKSFEDARLSQNQMKKARINATIERVKMSNELYEKVSVYAGIAKTLFAKTDTIRYNQYLLTKARKQKAEAKSDAAEDGEIRI